MAYIYNVVKSPIKGKIGTISRSSGYEYRDFYYTDSNGKRVHVVGWHRAIDITTLGTVVAFAKGKVVSVVKGITGQTTNPSGGNSVTLLHANGCKTQYCHLDNGSNNHLKVGDIVNEGDKLGTDIIKTTGNSTGLHLHFAIYNGTEYVDPTPYLQGSKQLVGYGNVSTSSNANTAKKSLDEIAKDVIAGKYGNYPERKTRLESEGYNYSEVQAKVDTLLNNNAPIAPTPEPQPTVDILTLVKKTIRGDFGNGETRKKALGSNFDEVQRQVNLNYKNGTTRWDNIKLY